MKHFLKISFMLAAALVPGHALYAQNDAMFIDQWGRVGIGTTTPKLRLTLTGDSAFGVDNKAAFYAKNAVGIYEPYFWPRTGDNRTFLNYGKEFAIRDNNSKELFNLRPDGNAEIEKNLTVKGNFYTNDVLLTHVTYNSADGAIDWGNNYQGLLYFRSLKTQGSYGNFTNVMTLSGSGDLVVTGKVTAKTIETATPKGNIARRDWRPYGKPSFCWRGTTDEQFPNEGGLFTTKGGATYSRFNGTWSGKKMYMLSNLSREAKSNNSQPTNGIYLTLKATNGIPNSLLLSTIDKDRWSIFSVWLCKADNSDPVKISRAGNNANGNDPAFTHILGPDGQFKEVSAHAWLCFPVSEEQVQKYISNDNLRFLITSGPMNDEAGTLYLSGIALVPNPYGFCQQTALSTHYGLNGENDDEIDWYSPNFAMSHLVQLSSSNSKSVHIKVVDPNKDMIVTFHEIADLAFRGSITVTVGNDNTKYYPSQGIASIASNIYRGLFNMRPASIIIPAAVVKANMLVTASGVNALKLNLYNPGDYPYYIFGIDSEFY